MHFTSTGICFLNKTPFMYFLHQKKYSFSATMMSQCSVTSQSWLTYLDSREAARCPGVQTRPAGVVGVADGPPVGVFGASSGHLLVGTGCLVGHNSPLLVGSLHRWGERDDWEGEHCMVRVQLLHHLRWKAVVCLCHKKVTNVIRDLHIIK